MRMKPSQIGRAINTMKTAAVLFCAAMTSAVAGPSPTPTPTVDLPRVKKHGELSMPQLTKDKVAIADLSNPSSPGASKTTDQTDSSLSYVVVDAGKDLSVPGRGSPKDLGFVSVFVYASDGTTVDVGGAKLTIKASSKPGYVRLLLGDPTSPSATAHALGDMLKVERQGNVSLAPLPVLTIRLDPTAGVWDVFMFDRLVASDLPLGVVANGADRKFNLHAGTSGAWLLGLVFADENPLCEDANHNGIDDKYELQQRGALLAANGPASERTQLAKQWRESQRTKQVIGWNVRRPLPKTP